MTQAHETQTNKTIQSNARRCAVYTRYSCVLQDHKSTEDQVRECRSECERHEGWKIAEDWVLSDEEVSGRSLVGRDAMAALKQAAKQRSRPFDCIIIDDTSRLGRNVPDVLRLAEIFQHNGVSIQFVSPPLNSSDPNFRPLLIFKAMMDEQYSAGLADKVRRGLKGRILKGYNAGGACYGYRNVEKKDPNGKGDIVLGVDLQIIPEQAAVILNIFELYSRGWSFDRIARKLRADGVSPPRPPRKNSVQGWSPDGISDILRNKKYIGIYEWGRTKEVYDPETGKTVTKKTPQTEWVCVENPKWRIVSDELWDKVQKQLALKRKIGIPKIGGLIRTPRSQQYLFSGLMTCGVCGGNVRIADGSGDNMRYGCGVHRDKAACSNATTIRRDGLEAQLLRWLTHDLVQDGRLDLAVTSFVEQLGNRISELEAQARKDSVNVPELLKHLAKETLEVRNITEFIAKAGSGAPVSLLTDLAKRDTHIRQLEERLALANKPTPKITFTADAVRESMVSKLRDLQSVLTSEPLLGRQIIGKHIKRIILTPGEVNGRRVFSVAVDFGFGGDPGLGVVLNEGVDASMQQYGFSTITITGPTLDACRVYRKRSQGTEHGVTVLPTPIADGTDATQSVR
jgi:site-specific DNA recombinase